MPVPKLQVWRKSHAESFPFQAYDGVPCVHQIAGKLVLADCGCLCSCDLRSVLIGQRFSPLSYSQLDFYASLPGDKLPVCGMTVREEHVWYGRSLVDFGFRWHYWFWSTGDSAVGIDFHVAWEIRIVADDSCSGNYGEFVVNCPNDVSPGPQNVEGLGASQYWPTAYEYIYGGPFPAREFYMRW